MLIAQLRRFVDVVGQTSQHQLVTPQLFASQSSDKLGESGVGLLESNRLDGLNGDQVPDVQVELAKQITSTNTNGLLRQYFPKGTDLSRHSAKDLAAVATALNSRPRKTLGWRTPAETLNDHILSVQQATVATTP